MNESFLTRIFAIKIQCKAFIFNYFTEHPIYENIKKQVDSTLCKKQIIILIYIFYFKKRHQNSPFLYNVKSLFNLTVPMCHSCPPASRFCYVCRTDHGSTNLQATGRLRRSHDSLSRILPELFNRILCFTPDSVLVVGVASRRLAQISQLFLHWNTGEVVRLSLHVNAPLTCLISGTLVNLRNRHASQPARVPIEFLMSVPESVRRLGIPPIECPDHILSAREIHEFNRRIDNANLLRIWGRVRRQVTEFHPVAENVPKIDASVREIRTWMRGDLNRTLLGGITVLSLDELQLTSVSLEVGLYTGLQELYLDNNQLVTLPQSPFHALRTLQMLCLENNRIACLPEGLFQGLSALQTLRLDCNELVSLPEGLFQGLTALRQLHLEDNQLALLPVNLFQGLIALQELHLDQNRLESLPAGLFRGLTTLQRLSLYSNRFVLFSEELFQELTTLQILTLNNNLLVSLQDTLFQGPTSLQKLTLYNNQLVSLPDRLFQGLSSLQRLYLYNNQLNSLPGGLFHGLTALQILSLHNNCLVSLPECLFQGLVNLQSLYLNNNPLVSLPKDLFQGLSTLQRLFLYNIGTVSFPEGLFRGLPSLQSLRLYGYHYGDPQLSRLYAVLNRNPRLCSLL